MSWAGLIGFVVGILTTVAALGLIELGETGDDGVPPDGTDGRIATLEARIEALQTQNGRMQDMMDGRAPTLQPRPSESPPAPAPTGDALQTPEVPSTRWTPIEPAPPTVLPGNVDLWMAGLRKAVERKDQGAIDHYVLALVALGSRAVPAMLAAAKDVNEDDQVRTRLLHALQRMRAPALDTLVVDLIASEPENKSLLLTALQLLATSNGAGPLPDAIRDMALDVRIPVQERTLALKALVRRDPGSAVEALQHMLADRDPQERERALQLLSTARDKAFAPVIHDVMKEDPPPRNAGQLLNTLAAMKGKGWDDVQMTGEPDTIIGGDRQTAWASLGANMGEVWVELDYAHAVRIDGLRIFENHNPGAIRKIQGKAYGGGWETLWEGEEPRRSEPNIFEPRVADVPVDMTTIRITLDTSAVQGWNEIDAVELIGGGRHQWAVQARSSSSYARR